MADLRAGRMMALFEGRASRVIDLFAGPGGWDVGARCLGIDPLGIEWDEAACATRKAAGLRTMRADVAALTPHATMREHFPIGRVPSTVGAMAAPDEPHGALDGLIASPPCQSFSMAGKRGGKQDAQHVIACVHDLAAGHDTRAEHRAKCVDERSMLVVEPVRWVRDLRPRWVALEQVPPVLSLWSLFAQILAGWGYRTWTGILSAERYGVPQTRKRAILMASLDFQPEPPTPTHQAYVPGEPQRHEVTMFGEVLPWVSMAQALGWEEGPSPSPSPSLTGGGGSTGGVEVFAGKAARERVKRGLRAGTNAEDQPAPTLRFSERLNDVSWVLRANAQENAAVRREDEPAPTITGGHDTGDRVWQPTHYDRRQVGGDGTPIEPLPVTVPAPTYERPIAAPAPTVDAKVGGAWKVAPEGEHRDPPQTWKRPELRTEGGDGSSAVRVSVQEAAILQSFPPDYPWQGSRTKQFEQIGNAVPPLLAQAVLRQLVDAQEVRDVA